MKTIRDASMIIGLLENGELNPAFSSEISETMQKLSEMSEDAPSRTIKGSVSLKLDFEVKDGMVTINSKLESKTPKRPRKSSVFWVLDGGALSTEHPRQHDLFPGPREINHAG